MKVSIIAFVILLACSESCLAQPANCTVSSRQRLFNLPDHQILRGDGVLGSQLTKVMVALNEYQGRDCYITLTYTLEFNIYNHWQNGKGHHAHAEIYLTMLDAFGKPIYGKFAMVSSPMNFCGPYNHPQGRHFKFDGTTPQSIRRYFDEVENVVMSSSRISGRIGRC